ncbi:NADH-ubiquinone oxidoreductase-F iron-sulfur binding region domain-containing protein [Methanobacterium alcaliphilum]|uniref:NADH-ubiquinone oxidoreductase-F iron-sulfur binding region domain-containing protein n=1 Tax=Methanobacterium alcaliphilum TaxID=392018 RepID=UPI00200B6A5C|nr:NADH-ubiquinone oxidoreductase-F iron-sulfur binding region domain-containing protein [Methanobacterium alcaliphilum]MCK9151984.1 4Fe-4S binding protein [Methanobacterium alcaliphilum]
MKLEEIVLKEKKDYNDLFSNKNAVLIGSATCGNSAGAQIAQKIIKEELEKAEYDCDIVDVGCIGLCYVEPIITVLKPDQPAVFYGNVTKKVARQIVNSHIIKGEPLQEYALGTYGEGRIDGINSLFEEKSMKLQERRILRNCGLIDPTNIGHYLAKGGYSGFMRALAMNSAEIISEMKKAGVRGRGGAGFPTWMKWQFCIDSNQETNYLICNADEGDPGAFMNRSLLESDPHSVLEGILIAAKTIHAEKAYIYCRAEYPLALERLEIAIAQMEENGLLGENIQGSGFNLEIIIKEGAGAFVCGEETALMASIEGERGTPRTRPPFPTTEGLFGKPTVINNVETMASAALILQKGAETYSDVGTKESKGTKTFSLVGQVKNTGLIEVPLGTTLKEVIFDIGGGIVDDGNFKAVQIGGPSGGCVPLHHIDTPIDYSSLIGVGAMMGSGGLVVMDEKTCMVEVARYFLEFIQRESCGKCVPCRLGTKQMLDVLTDITEGKGTEEDLEILPNLAQGIKQGSLCALGQSSPNPVLTTTRFFMNEYESHIKNRICPAKECKEFIQFAIDPQLCDGCMVCLKSCPVGAVSGSKDEVHEIDLDKCIKCGTCMDLCKKKKNAVEVVNAL